MKVSAATVLAAALSATPAVVGFTVTMSSVAYLDKITFGGTLTSFAPSAGYSPAPSSTTYGAPPAPAPVPTTSYNYKSPFADLPASTDVNYMKNLAGGSAMKSGSNYSGVSRKFYGVSSQLPYSAAAAAAPAPAPAAPYVSSFSTATTATTTTTTTSTNYMGSLSGGSAMKSGPNYSGVNNRQWGPTTTTQSASSNTYSATPAPAPYVSSFSTTTTAPASNALNYMGSLGGGSAMKSGSNYSGVSNKFGPTKASSSSYLDAVATTTTSFSAPVTASSGSSSSTNLNYISSLGGGNAMKSGKNYSGVSNKFGPIKSNSYLDAVATASPVSSSSGSSSTTNLNYMSSLGGGNAMKSGKNYSGVNNKFRPTKSNSYLDAVATASPVSAASGSSSSNLNYMGSLGGGNAMKSGKNYSGVNNKFRPTKSNSYLDAVSTAAPFTSTVAAATSSSSTTLNYMGSLGGGNAMKSGKNYSGVNNKFRPAKSNSYLDAVSTAAPFVSSVTTSTSTTTAVSSSNLNYMGSLGGGNSMKSGKNYSGVSNKFGPTRSNNSYLDQVKGAVFQSTTYAAAPPAAAPAATSSSSYVNSFAAAPAAATTNGLNYMGSLGGGNAMKNGKNYAGFGSTFASAKSTNPYLESVKHGATTTTPSYSYMDPLRLQQAPPPQAPPGTTNYLEHLSAGGTAAVSSSYASMQNSFAAASGAAAQPTAPASTSSYLSSL